MTTVDPHAPGGWAWFEAAPAPGVPETAEDERALALACARCFRGGDGERVLAYLRALTLDRALGPNASDTLLRHLEGQRQLVAHIASLVRRGRGG